MALTHIERRRLDEIKDKWDQLKEPPPLPVDFARAVALWACINVDYLIVLAERADRP